MRAPRFGSIIAGLGAALVAATIVMAPGQQVAAGGPTNRGETSQQGSESHDIQLVVRKPGGKGQGKNGGLNGRNAKKKKGLNQKNRNPHRKGTSESTKGRHQKAGTQGGRRNIPDNPNTRRGPDQVELHHQAREDRPLRTTLDPAQVDPKAQAEAWRNADKQAYPQPWDHPAPVYHRPDDHPWWS